MKMTIAREMKIHRLTDERKISLLEIEPVMEEEEIDDDDSLLGFDSEDLELASATWGPAAFQATGSDPEYKWSVCVMWNPIITKDIEEHRQEDHQLYGHIGIGKRMSIIAREIDDCFDYKLPFMLLDVKGLNHHNIDGSMSLAVVETATERNFDVSEDGRLWELVISETCSKLGFEMLRCPATTVMLWGSQVEKHEQCKIGEEPIGRLVLSLHSNDVSAIIFHEEEISVDREVRMQRNISRSELCDFSDSSWHMIYKCKDTTTFALYASGNTGSIRLRGLDGPEYDSELEECSSDESFQEVASQMDVSEIDSGRKRDSDDGVANVAINFMACEEKDLESGVDEENDILESFGILPLKFTTDSQTNILQSQMLPMEDDGSESDGISKEDKGTTEGVDGSESDSGTKRDSDDGVTINLMPCEEKELENGVDEENDILESLGILPLKFTTDSQANFLQSQKLPMEDDESDSDGNGQEDKCTTEAMLQHNVESVDTNEAEDSNAYRFTQLLEDL